MNALSDAMKVEQPVSRNGQIAMIARVEDGDRCHRPNQPATLEITFACAFGWICQRYSISTTSPSKDLRSMRIILPTRGTQTS
jgi:hypothetical protein